jgi:hypothetical protein
VIGPSTGFLEEMRSFFDSPAFPVFWRLWMIAGGAWIDRYDA